MNPDGAAGEQQYLEPEGRTGDRKILADNYEMMQKWYAFLLGRARQTTEEQQGVEYAKYTALNGLDYGEWCEPGIIPMQAMMNPRKSVGTAYLAYSDRLLAEIAAVLGKPEEAAQYRGTAEKARLAYRAAFTDNGKITSDQQCVDYIEMHLDQKILAADLAKQVGYTEYYLTHKFKEETGLSVTNYTKFAKIERARVLLKSTDQTVQEIAEQLGFGTRNYFSRVFQEVAGKTPVEFRENG